MTVSDLTQTAPRSDYDPYSDQALISPWDGYRELRDAGPAVWLSKYEMYALTRYDSVRRVLENWEDFPSRNGVMMNDEMNMAVRGNTLCSDGADHQKLRGVIAAPIMPRALQSVRGEVAAQAAAVVASVIAKGTFDAVTELAEHLPVSIISEAVGLPEKGRERMLVWAEEMLNCFGPINERTVRSFPVLHEMMEYATNEAVRGKLKPGGWAEGVLDAVDEGVVPEASCPAMMIDYMGSSLGTMIAAISTAIRLFAENPDQWDLVHADPSLVRSAINEVLRYDSPVQGFSRYVERDVDVDGVLLPAGSRVIAFYGAGNRDERHYPDPDRFDVRRGASDHLAFGAGPHACVGMHVALIEMRALFTELAKHVRRFEIVEEERALNNVLRMHRRLVVRVS